MNKLLSSLEVSILLNCTKRGVHYLVKTGKLTPVNSQKRFFLFDKNEVLILKNTRENG
jgi:hypothetical protein